MNHPMLLARVSRRHKSCGATVIEFALASTIFITFLLGSVLWGLTMWEINTLQYAVERGARCAILPIPPSGEKLCGGLEANAASNAHALPGITAANFVVQSQDFSYVNGTLSQKFTSACVSTKDVLNPFAMPLGLAGANSSIGTIRYCRSKQN